MAQDAETYRWRRRRLPGWMEQLDQIGATVRAA
jgi:hypothetical protein